MAKTKKKKIKLIKRKSAKVEKTIGNGGAHWHNVSGNPDVTEMDGAHQHLFIINGLPAWSFHDGVHSHPVNAVASRTGPENERHKHMIKVGQTNHQVDPGGTHLHELDAPYDGHLSTTVSGLHRHVVDVEGVEYQSLMPGDLLQSEVRKRVAIEIQSVHVSNLLFPDVQEAVQFIEERGFIGRDVLKVDDGFRFKQLSRDRFQESTLKELELSNGVIAVVGILDPEKMSAENQTLDSLKDINPAEEIMREDQVAALSRLKDAYAGMVIDMKIKAEKFIPILNQFVDLSEEFVKNEPFQVFLTEFIDSFNVLQSEITRVDTPDVLDTKSEKRVKINFEDHVRDIEVDLEKLTDIFYESEAFDNFGRVLKKNHLLFKQMILNLPLIRAAGEGTPIGKAFNDFIDFEIVKVEELEHMNSAELSKLKIKEMDLTKLNESQSLDQTLQVFLKKVGGDHDNIVVEFGPRSIESAISIHKNQSDLVDICYNLDKGIPLPANSVNKIYANTLSVLSDREQIMKEVSRVLKDGGELVVESLSTDGRTAFLPCFKSLWNEEVFKYFTSNDDSLFEMVESSTELKEDKSSAMVKVKMVRCKRNV